MPLYYLPRTVASSECIGNSLSTINIGLSTLDTNLYNLSSYAVNSINFLSANSVFQQTEIDFLSADSVFQQTEINFLSASVQTLRTTVSSNSAMWTSAYNSLVFDKSITVITNNLYTFSDISIVLFDCIAASITAIMPSVPNNKQYTAKKIDGSSNFVVLSANNTNKIDGLTSRSLTGQYDHVTFVSNSSGWWII